MNELSLRLLWAVEALRLPFRWLSQAFCGLRGHDDVRQFGGNRTFYLCTSCKRQTPGWTQDYVAPRKRFDGDPSHHRIR